MTLGASLCLIAAGAILRSAITAHVEGVNLQNMGVILGGIGLGIGLYLVARARSTTEPRPGPF